MADNPDSLDRALRSRAERDLGSQRDPGSGSHAVRVLGARSELLVSGTREERIAAVARRQRGRIARRQLLAIGISAGSIAWRVARAHLFPTLRGVFVVGHVAEVELGAETEALLSVREGAAISHWSAATMWGLWTPAPKVVEVLLNDAPAAVNPGVRVHRSRILEPRDIHIREDLPVTSPARTLLDIAPTATDRRLELAFDRALRGKMRPSQVADVLDRASGHPGRKRLAVMLERETVGTTMTRSKAEERMLALMRAARLPQPLVNADVAGYEVDFYWPDHKFAVEVDSWQFHSGRRAFEEDRQKDQGLRRAGIDPMRTTATQLKYQPYVIVAGVAGGLARAAASGRP